MALGCNEQPVAPGKRTLSWYLEPVGRDGRDARGRQDAQDGRDAPARGELPFRLEMERLFGEPLDEIAVEQDGALPRGALAAAERERIVFAGAEPSKATVAHEVAHVLQYRRGAPRTAARIGERGDPAEREAHRAAADAVAGRSVHIRGAPGAQMHLQEAEEADGGPRSAGDGAAAAARRRHRLR
jgi:hypothetical protein